MPRPMAAADPPDVLPDVLGPGLRIVFCGSAAGAVSARVGAYYAGPGNRFWPTLHRVGLTPRLLAPAEFRTVLRLRHRAHRPLQDGSGRGRRSLPARRRCRRARRQDRATPARGPGLQRQAGVARVSSASRPSTMASSRGASARPLSTCCRRPLALRGAGGMRRSGAEWRTPRAEHARRQEDEAARNR